MCHYPVIHYSFRVSLEQTFFLNYPFSWWRHFIETLLTVLGSLAWAVAIPSISKVFDLTGALSAFPITFLCPALAYLKICFFSKTKISYDDDTETMLNDSINTIEQEKSWTRWLKTILPILMSLFAIITMAISIYVAITNFLPSQ